MIAELQANKAVVSAVESLKGWLELHDTDGTDKAGSSLAMQLVEEIATTSYYQGKQDGVLLRVGGIVA